MKKLLAALTFLLLPTFAHASPITFGFTGTTFLGNFFGSYTFDSEGVPAAVPDGNLYTFNGGPYGMAIDFLGVPRQWTGLEIRIHNDEVTGQSTANPPISDLYFVHGLNGPNTFLNLRDCDGEALSSTSSSGRGV